MTTFYNGSLSYGTEGTSLSCPCWAGLVAIADQGLVASGGTTLNSTANPQQALQVLYGLPARDFHDITSGYNGFSAGPGYDFVTGRGTPIANLLIPDLIGSVLAPTVTVATPAAALNPVTGITTSLSVQGADSLWPASSLTYTWSATALPGGAAAPALSDNGTTTASNTTAAFGQAGTYLLTVTITDPSGSSATSTVSVTVDQTVTTIAVSPAPVTIGIGATQQFTAAAYDQFGAILTAQPGFVWSTDIGTIDPNTGLLTAPSLQGTGTVTATYGTVSGTNSVAVIGLAGTETSVASSNATAPTVRG